MPGFYLTNFPKVPKFEIEYIKCNHVYRSCNIGEWTIQSLVLDKYIYDKLFLDISDYFYMSDGVVLNSKQLVLRGETKSFDAYIERCLTTNNLEFYKDFRGTFSGALYHKKTNQWECFTTQSGDRPVFYYNNSGFTVVSSSIDMIVKTLKLNQVEYSVDVQGIYNILTYAHMQDDETLIREIRRLGPGEKISISSAGIQVTRYHSFTNSKTLSLSEEEIIDTLDVKFRDAIKLQFDKDAEYGYTHLASLSSGYDARMCVWVANDLGYKDIHTCTFSQTGFVDAIIAEQIASCLRFNHMFKPLDDGRMMMNIENAARMCYGMVSSSQIVHALHMMENLDLYNIGMLHTGQIGDAVLGSFMQSINHSQPKPFTVTYSRYLSEYNKDESYKKYENLEMYLIYTRAFRGALGSQIAHSHYIEMYSPFCDVDFLEFCLSIPLDLRVNHYIYKKWIIRKYPQAGSFPWGSTGEIVSDPKWKQYLHFCKRKVEGKVKRCAVCLLGKTKVSINAMVPYDYYYGKYDDIAQHFNQYYEEFDNDNIIPDSVRNHMNDLFHNGNSREKMQVLTVATIIKQYFKFS